MWKKSEERVLFNHGWEHFWYNPKNLSLKEFIKGPFLNPKLVHSIPYVIPHQEDGNSVKLQEGIPDCWAEYLAHNFIFPRTYLRNYELMHKEDVEIVPQLRKNYRLYIGQGIPNPWKSYSYLYNPRNFTDVNPKDVKKQLLHFSRRKKGNCYCCEKKYLFECPDKNNIKNCRCRDCHEKNVPLAINCGENCKCLSVFRDWVLKNTDIKRRKHQCRKTTPGYELSSSDNYKADDEGPLPKAESLMVCECSRHKDISGDISTSDLGEEAHENTHNFNNRNKMFSKYQARVCCCPFVRNVYLEKNSSPNGRNCPENTTTISKQIQTENEKYSKTVQTDYSKSRIVFRCQCNSICLQCGAHQCKTPWAKIACAAPQAVPNMCFTPGMIQNPAILCPCPFPNHVIVQKPSKHDEVKKASKKQEKSRVNEDGSSFELKCKRRQSKADVASVLKKSDTKHLPTDTKDEDLNNNKSVFNCQTLAKDLDHFKYLTDEKLKYYLKREALFGGSKFVSFGRGDQSISALNPDRFNLGGYKPTFSESAEDCKMVYLRSGRHHTSSRLFNSSDQATMTMSEETQKSKKVSSTKVNHFKDLEERNEFIPCGLTRNCNNSYEANRRRRRLLANRKRRKKLAASGKSSILEYQALMNKLPKQSELVNKHVQVEGIDEDCQFSKKIYFTENNSSVSGLLNFYENTTLRHKDASFKPGPLIAGTMKRVEEEAVKNGLGEHSKGRISWESPRQSLRSDMIFSKALEKISSSNKGSWTSNALKNIIDDILTEKKS